MCRDHCAGRVEHPDAGVDEPLERPEPFLHAVQLLVHIEAAERDVPQPGVRSASRGDISSAAMPQ
jgi:hypothetical protein